MKKITAILAGVFFWGVTSAYSLPILQLDADPGYYVGGDEESTVTDSPTFDLIALLDANTLSNYGDYQFFVSVALTPKTETFADFGSFDFNGTTYSFSPDDWGTPPSDSTFGKSNDLPSHGIYDTWYKEFAIDFSLADTVDAYNVQTDEMKAGDELLALSFLLDLTNLASDFNLHFDLYGYMLDEFDNPIVRSMINAPFSHDATTRVPEPATVLLLGIGLVGLAVMSRRPLKS